MLKNKKFIAILIATIFIQICFLDFLPARVSAKSAVPQVAFASAPVTEYVVGDRVRFDIYAPNYGGRVEYRVVLWEDSKKTYHDLWNSSNGFPNRYYTKWQPYGNNTFTLGWPIFEPGSYRITVYVKRLGISNSNAALKGMNCDSYKESVAFVVKPKVESAAISLDKDGQTYGPADPEKPESIAGNVKITANDVTYNNSNIQGSLYISSNNAVVNNLFVKDTVYVDPGKDGSAVLNNVHAKDIKILSGAENSIHLKNVTSENVTVSSSSRVRVVSEGNTSIGDTFVNSSAILDNKEGSFGKVTVLKGQNGKPEVEFSGSFNEAVTVNAESVVKAAPGANIIKLILATENNEDLVTINGDFNTVEISKGARIFVDGNIQNLDVKAKSVIETTSNTVIEILNKNGFDVTVSGTGIVNQLVGENTGSTGEVIIPGGEAETKSLAVEAAGVVLSNGKKIKGTRIGDTDEYLVDLTGYERTIGVRTSFTVNKDCTLEIMGGLFEFNAHTPRVFGPKDFGMPDNDPPGISIANLIDNFADGDGYYSDSVTMNGETGESVTVTIRMKVK